MSTVRLGVVGAGLVGKRHIDIISKSSNIELAGIVEPSDSGDDLASKLKSPLYTTLGEMLSEAKIDGVVIATPTPIHVEQALSCIEAECAVLVEKPIAVNAGEAEILVRAADSANIPLLVGHHRRYNPLIKSAYDIINSGDIGRVRAIQSTCWFYKPDHYFEVAPWRKGNGAGPISVNLVHDVDLIRHLVGDIVSVQAQATPSVRGFSNEDVAAAVLRFENGAIGTITVSDSIAAPWSWEHTSKEYPIYPATPENCYLIGGSSGSLSIPDLRLWRHEGEVQDWWTPISATSQVTSRSDPLHNQLQHFADVIKGNAKPLVSGLDGLKTLRVVEAIQKSAASGETIFLS